MRTRSGVRALALTTAGNGGPDGLPRWRWWRRRGRRRWRQPGRDHVRLRGDQSDAFTGHRAGLATRRASRSSSPPRRTSTSSSAAGCQGNNLPDIAIFPQPGITLDIARSGKLADLRRRARHDAVDDDVPGIIEAATAEDGKVYAAPMSISVKSLVWYPKAAVREAGYKVPKTQEELLALTEQIKADGTAPWCVGIECGPPPAGRPPTGWRTTSCGSAAPRATTSGSSTRSRSTTRGQAGAATRSPRSGSPRATCSAAAGRSPARTSHRGQPDVR